MRERRDTPSWMIPSTACRMEMAMLSFVIDIAWPLEGDLAARLPRLLRGHHNYLTRRLLNKPVCRLASLPQKSLRQ
jgi:hypothetical protein